MSFNLARIFHKDRREKPERVVDMRHAWKNTRRHAVSMLRVFFKCNEVDAILSGFAAGRSKSTLFVKYVG